MFAKRNAALVAEIKQLQASEVEPMQQQNEGNEKEKIRHANYSHHPTYFGQLRYSLYSGKNQLWKLVLKKVSAYRSQADELSIHLYPNLPQVDSNQYASKTT